ncbi:AEC family transporter [Halobacteriaceae archaeon GCM10025711]
MSFLDALTTAILPVLAIAAVGFGLGRTRDVDVEALSTITIYVLTPALVFSSLTLTPLSGNAVARLGLGVLLFTLLMVGAAESVARLTGEQEPIRGALVLTSTFPNAGNYGIPLSAFAFGAVGRSTAVLYIAAQAVLMYTIGVYIASRGQTGAARSAVSEVFRLPLVYAVLAAGLARWLDVVPPADSALMQTIELTGNAAIPVMLLMLGIQLANTSYGAALSRVRAATVLKVAVAPVLAAGIALGLGMGDQTVARVFVLECAMPAAITPLMLTIEFGGDAGGDVSAPEYVSTAIMVTTLLSIPTLAVLITLLQSGAVI